MMRQPKALVVDDDQNIISAFKDFLTREDCTMISTSDTAEAVRQINHQKFDLLITDVKLKNQLGTALVTRVKRLHPQTPVIVITGYPELVTEEVLWGLGADYFFVKPFDLLKMRKAVRKCLDRHAQ